jgi:Ca-activated chloride channel family protein
MFRFAHPLAFGLLALAFAWFALAVRRGWGRHPGAMLYSDTRLLDGLPTSWRIRYHQLPDGLRALAWVLLIVALARPQSGRMVEVTRGQGIDIVLALDISGSMAALDFAPQSRLEAAKTVIQRFMAGREFDRIGLVVFSRDSFQVLPPNLDYRTLLFALENIRLASELNLEDGTAIGMGLASGANMLRKSEAASKIIILMTDGANNAGSIGPLTVAQMLSALKIRVYTIGMGKPGRVPVPVDAAGNTQLIESDLDEAVLKSVASATGGAYFRAEDLSDLQRIYDRINGLERSDVERQTLVRWQDQAAVLLWAGLLLLAIERVLRHTVFQTLP